MLHILHPFYLFGLLLAVIPLILHLLGRRRIREKPFSSIYLLKEMKKSTSVWLRIRELLLLLLRILFITFIIIAFSHPLVESPLSFLGKEAPRDVAILLDVSMSMGMEGVFEKAKNEVLRVFKTYNSSDRILLIAFSDRVEGIEEISDRTELIVFLNNLKVTYRATDLLPALGEAEKSLLQKEGFSKRVYIVSDFQKSGLKNVQSVSEGLGKKGIDVYAFPIERDEKNLFFSGYRIEPPFPLSGIRLKLFPELISREEGQNPIELFMNGVMKGAKKQTASRAKTVFEIEPLEAGYRSGFFRTGGDALAMDNSYYFSFYIPENLNVLLVGKTNEYYYLANALSPGLNSPIKLKTIAPEEFSRVNLGDYDLLILYNTKLNGSVKVRSMDFLANGGSVLIVMGNAFKSEINKDVLGGIHIERKMYTEKGFFRVKMVDVGFEPLSDFRDKGLKNLYDTKFFRYFRIESNMREVIKCKNGDPLMLTGNINKGKIVLLPFSIDPEWTQLPIKAIFVPLIYKLTFYLARKQERIPLFNVGAPIKLSFSKEVKEPLFITPDNRKKSPIPLKRMDEVNYILKDIDIPGIYRFVSQQGETIPVAVNTNVKESRLDAFSFEELKTLFPDIKKSEEVKTFTSSGKKWVDLFLFFIVLSLMCLIAELILENK